MLYRIPPKGLSLLIAVLMCAASIGGMVARPDARAVQEPAISLEAMIPRAFGDWREEPHLILQVVNPQTEALLDKLYSQVLNRAYVNSQGYRIMLSAYGGDQRAALQAHKPEVCYLVQGFTLHASEAAPLVTPYGVIPVRRLFTTMGTRQEPVTYWFTVGNRAVEGRLEKRDLWTWNTALRDVFPTACSSAFPRPDKANRN